MTLAAPAFCSSCAALSALVTLVTGTKFHRQARITGLKLSEVTHIVTDTIDPPLEDSLINLGIDVIQTESKPPARV